MSALSELKKCLSCLKTGHKICKIEENEISGKISQESTMKEPNSLLQRWQGTRVDEQFFPVNTAKYPIDTEDFGNFYIQIMEACQPFYQPMDYEKSCQFRIPARLEDGLAGNETGKFQGNPQEAASVSHKLFDNILMTTGRLAGSSHVYFAISDEQESGHR